MEITRPSPDELRLIIKKHDLTRKEAAELLHVALKTLHTWLAPLGSKENRAVPVAAWELLLIKLGEHKEYGKLK